jgi:hypothetical protein
MLTDSLQNMGQEANTLPEEFKVAVLMQRRQATLKPWLSPIWRVAGVVVNSRFEAAVRRGVQVRSGPEGEDYLWGGLTIRLYKDELESYYHNLTAPNPSVFVIMATNEQGVPEPLRVSASYDEANAYLEADGEVEGVPMPAEIHQWLEQYVIVHYLPERKTKRKRQNWSDGKDHE